MIVLAHGLSGRSDLPLPGWLFAWAAALALAASFFLLAALWRRPVLETARPRTLIAVPRSLAPLCGAVGVLVLVGLIYAGLAGTQDETRNILPTFVYVLLWAALPVVSALAGDVFRPFNPWLATGRAASAVRSGLLGGRNQPRFRYPERLGMLPAVAGLGVFGYLELISPHGRDPGVLAMLAIVYSIVQFCGMAMFGARCWVDRGEIFNVYLGVCSRLAPLAVDGRNLIARPPLSGLTDISWPAGGALFVCAAIGLTAFDGASEGALWGEVAASLGGAFEDAGMEAGAAGRLAGCVGLAGAVAIVYGFFRLGVTGMVAAGADMPPDRLMRAFAGSLVPIMLAYVLSHYLSFVVFQGQGLFALVSDPLGDGSDLFGTAGVGIDYGVVSGNTIWRCQAAILVLGHIAGLVVAHDRAVAQWGTARVAARTQSWMLVVMVGFTSMGLWLLSQANG